MCLVYLPTQIRFPIGGERVTCRRSKLAKGHVTRSNFSCNLHARKNSRVTPHFATAIVALRVARKVERPYTFRNVAGQVACV